MTPIKYLVFVSIFFILLNCNNKIDKKVKIKTKDGIFLEGIFFKDSLFHGLVKYFDSSNRYLGYTNYSYGLENGPDVIYSNPNIKSDSFNYVNGLRNGYAYKYDSLGRLAFKVFYFHGLITGSTTAYDTNQKIVDYYFLDLDGNLLYSNTPINDSMSEEKGSLINSKINSIKKNGLNKSMLFLYILDIPFYKSHYEIAILDKNKTIISSNKISTTDFYYEQELDSLSNGNFYAIVFHKYNNFKGRDDLVIQPIDGNE